MSGKCRYQHESWEAIMNTCNRSCIVTVANLLLAAAFSTATRAEAAQEATINVAADKPGPAISPMLYGLMTEEINHSYDGGLYGELIRNRDFKEADKKDPTKPAWWSPYVLPGAGVALSLDRQNPVNATGLPVSLKVEIKGTPDNNGVGLRNDGFWGIPIRTSARYVASFYARGEKGFTGPLTVRVEGFRPDPGGVSQFVGAVSDPISLEEKWKKYSVTLAIKGNLFTTDGELLITADKPGTFWLSQVSLFPATYKNRPNGNRIDLMKKMAEMRPAFLRFPGGNYLEGDTIADRFDWKKTIGPLEDRPGHRCCWGYPSSDGFGLMEFLYWCEDLNMEPILGVYAGYSLKGQHVEKPDELKPFIQDALDEIEFVSGAADTIWGHKRAELGHPAPFKLRYVEIGNEDWFDKSRSYDSRFAQFYDAIKEKYPKLQLIATTKVNGRKPDLLDDHYYRSAAEMQRDVHHYDKSSRTGPKIFVGEWATTEGRPTPTLNAALGDAAWMTGMERNSDLIVISCYAPLFVNVERGASQWGTNLIGYDALTSYGSPSYYAQVMFAQNRGDVVLSVKIDAAKIPPMTVTPRPRRGRTAPGPVSVDPLYATASRDKATGDVILKLVNIVDEPIDAKINIAGIGHIASHAKAIVLTGERRDQNSIAEPTKVAPREETISNAGPVFTRTLPARSITVLRLKAG
jgi:alpha-N-arabinofuranosidase